jgi:hypothetical protein
MLLEAATIRRGSSSKTWMSDSLRGFGARPEMRRFGRGTLTPIPGKTSSGRRSGSLSPGTRSGWDTIHSWISLRTKGYTLLG